MYRVINAFNDLLDGGFLYKVGDEYPRRGYSATDKRVQELLSSSNKQQKPLIEAVEVVEASTEAATPTRKKRGKKNENN